MSKPSSLHASHAPSPRKLAGPRARPVFRFNKATRAGPGVDSDDSEDDGGASTMPTLRRLRRSNSRRLGWHSRKAAKNDILAGAGEFVGTLMFLLMAFVGSQSANFNRGKPANDTAITVTDNQTILFIALSFGMSLLVTAWAFFRITGAAFNPAVTLCLWLIGSLTGRRALIVSFAQMLGGIAAAGLAKALTLGTFALGNATTPGITDVQGLFLEMFATALLSFTVMMTAAEKHKSTFLAPVAIGLALFVGHLASVGWTGAGINPARTFGPSVVNGFFPSNAWLWYVGQGLGALLATVIYVALKHLDYDEVVADIDTADQAQSNDVKSGPLMTALAAVNPAQSESTPTEGSEIGGPMATVERREGTGL